MAIDDIEKEYMRSGHMACPGCGVATTMRLVLKALGEKTIVVIIPSCVGVISAAYPNSTLTVPCFHSAFEIAAPTAAGIACALKIKGEEDTTVLAFAGDGGTFDIGLQSLSGAADRNDNFIYVCLDNEGLHEHRHPVQFGHASECLDHDHPGRKKGEKETVYANHRRPPNSLCGHGLHRLSAGSYGKGEEGQSHKGDPFYPYPDPLPDRLEDA